MGCRNWLAKLVFFVKVGLATIMSWPLRRFTSGYEVATSIWARDTVSFIWSLRVNCQDGAAQGASGAIIAALDASIKSTACLTLFPQTPQLLHLGG